MEAMNIKIAKARYRSGIAFMGSFTGSSAKRLQPSVLFWYEIQQTNHYRS